MYKITLCFLLLTFNLFSSDRLKTNIELLEQKFAIMETGNFSVDIRREPIPLKSDAMKDYLADENLTGSQGAYFGNQNQSWDDRDASMVQIPDLKVFGVDVNQQNIIEGVEPIGVGPEATLNKLNEILSLPAEQRPLFLAFDVDDTLVGLTKEKTKENLYRDRKDLGLAIATLAKEGVKIAFFTDGDSQATMDKIGYSMSQLLESLALEEPVTMTFYVSGMITKFKMIVDFLGDPIIVYQPSYNAHCRIEKEHLKKFVSIVGKVEENAQGEMVGFGIMNDYYFKQLTLVDEMGKSIRNTNFFPEYICRISTNGNVIPPKVEVRDYNHSEQDASMISISGVPTQYRKAFIKMLEESFN